LLAAALMLASLACVGHSGARADWVGWFQLGADMAHLLAAGLWLGSLPALALLLSRGAPDEAAAATRRFSGFGIVAVATLLGTGAFNTYLLTDSITDLIETDYGRLLLLKLGLFATMVAFAAFNRLYWTPRLPGAGAANAIRRHSLVEAALGLGVITIVGALGTLPPPLHRHVHPTEPPSDAAFVHIHDVRAMTDVTVTPGRPGANEISLNLMQEDFTPQPAEAVSVELLQPRQSSVAAQARTIAPGRWNASAVLPSGGVWTVVVTIRTGAGPPIVLDGPIVLGSGSPAKSAQSE
jgi:putative copper resistance protein D